MKNNKKVFFFNRFEKYRLISIVYKITNNRLNSKVLSNLIQLNNSHE